MRVVGTSEMNSFLKSQVLVLLNKKTVACQNLLNLQFFARVGHARETSKSVCSLNIRDNHSSLESSSLQLPNAISEIIIFFARIIDGSGI